MGSKTPATTTQMQNSTTQQNPWATATPLLNNLVGGYLGVNPAVTPAQSAAGQNLIQSAGGIPNLTPQATQAVQNIFGSAGMLPTTWGQVSGNLSPIAGMSANPYQTPGFSDALGTLTQNITNSVKGGYAASGRSPSGAGAEPGVLARGLMQGEAPIIQDQYNKNIGNIMSANQMLTNAGINTSQAMGGNMLQALQGAGLLPSLAMGPAAAQYQAANQVYGQPIQNLNQILTPASVLAGQGGTTTGVGTATGTQTPANDPWANILGGVIGGAGMLGSLGTQLLVQRWRAWWTGIADDLDTQALTHLCGPALSDVDELRCVSDLRITGSDGADSTWITKLELFELADRRADRPEGAPQPRIERAVRCELELWRR